MCQAQAAIQAWRVFLPRSLRQRPQPEEALLSLPRPPALLTVRSGSSRAGAREMREMRPKRSIQGSSGNPTPEVRRSGLSRPREERLCGTWTKMDRSYIPSVPWGRKAVAALCLRKACFYILPSADETKKKKSAVCLSVCGLFRLAA